jgi:hypothetical protein
MAGRRGFGSVMTIDGRGDDGLAFGHVPVSMTQTKILDTQSQTISFGFGNSARSMLNIMMAQPRIEAVYMKIFLDDSGVWINRH